MGDYEVPLCSKSEPSNRGAKFLTCGSARQLLQNHDQLLAEFAKSSTKINDILARLQIQAEIFDEPLMRQKLEELFVALIHFQHETLRFYEEGKWRHGWRSLVGPFSLRLAPKIQFIEACAASVTEYSKALSQQEQHTMSTNLENTSKNVNAIWDLLVQLNTKIERQSICLRDLQVAGMIRNASTDSLDEPDSVLGIRISLCNLHRARHKTDIDVFWKSSALDRWNTGEDIHLLVVQGTLPNRFELSAIGTYMTQYVRRSKTPVLFALQSSSHQMHDKITPIAIFRYLAMQALRLNSESVSQQVSDELNSVKVASASNELHWMSIIASALRAVRQVYVVVDLDLVIKTDESGTLSGSLLLDLARLIAECKPTKMKIVVLSNRRLSAPTRLPSGGQLLRLDTIFRRHRGASVHHRRGRVGTQRVRGQGAMGFQTRLMDSKS